MKRFSDRDLVILKGENCGFFYDVPTNSIFKTSISDAEKAIVAQSKESSSADYQALEALLIKYIGGKDVQQPSHSDAFETKRLDKLTMLVATTCNLRCKYCFAGYGEYDGYDKQLLTPENAVSYIKALNRYFDEIGQIQFFGGEPLLGISAIDALCAEIRHMVKEGKLKKIPQYTMITNLTLIDDKTLNIIKEHNIRLTISLDGPKEINDQQRVDIDGVGTFDIVSANIIKCKSQIAAFEATYTKVHEKSGWTMEEVREYLSTTFQIADEFITVVPAYGNSEICFEAQQAKTAKLKLRGLALDDAPCLYALKPANQTDLLCNAGFTLLAIMPNGDLYPCHQYAMDRSFCISTYGVEAVGYPNLIPKVHAMRDMLLQAGVDKLNQSECKNCWARKICHRCPAESLIYLKQKRLDYNCDLRRQSMKQHLTEGLELTMPHKEVD